MTAYQNLCLFMLIIGLYLRCMAQELFVRDTARQRQLHLNVVRTYEKT